MSILFENRITPAGKQAIQDALDYVASELEGAVEAHGEDSPQAAQLLLAFISIEQIIEPSEDAHARIERYLAMSEKIYGRHSVETANGLLILGWSHGGLGTDEEAELAIDQALSLPEGRRDFPPVEPMLETLCGLLDKLQDNLEPEGAQLAFVLGVYTLSWLVTYCPIQSPSFHVFIERLRPLFESRGFRDDTWEWLMRRCNRQNNHTVGLISVLLEEGMFRSTPKETKGPQGSDPDGELLLKGYRISGIKGEHWTTDAGFSKTFPIIVAEGELSGRVERLLSEGCRCLSTTGELQTVFLIFSDHLIGRQITAFGTGALKVEKDLFRKMIRETIADLGADSAMMLTWVELRQEKRAESDEEPPEAVMVVARDAKSYFRGLQPARKIEGEYVFDEPMIGEAKNDWFSEFTFPVEPQIQSRSQTPAEQEAK